MNFFFTVFLAILAAVSGKHGRHLKSAHDLIESMEPALPPLTDKQNAALAKFENKKIFKQVWEEARQKVHHKMDELRKRSSPLHRRLHRNVVVSSQPAVEDEMAFD